MRFILFWQVSPFKCENVRLLKNKIDVFQQSFQSVPEAEGETGFSGLSQVDDASQEAGCCKLIIFLVNDLSQTSGLLLGQKV